MRLKLKAWSSTGLVFLACLVFSVQCASRSAAYSSVTDSFTPDCSYPYSEAVTINCRVAGTRATTFVMLHGFGTSIETWHDIQPVLSTVGSVYMLDLKGFGLSSKPDDGAYSPADQAVIVASFIENRGLADVILVGHSYGGGIALLTYDLLRRRGLYVPRALVLIDAAVYRQDLPGFVLALRAPVLNRILLNLTTTSYQARYLLGQVFRNKDAITADRVSRHARFLDSPGAHNSLIASARQIDDVDQAVVLGVLRDIEVPTLIVWGSHDPVVPVANGHRLNEEIQGSRLEIVPDSGHVPHEEFPEATVDAITRFYGTLPGPPASAERSAP